MDIGISLPTLIVGILLLCVFGRVVLFLINFALKSGFIFVGVILSIGAIGYVVSLIAKA